MAISTDFMATLDHWKKELKANYTILSDHMRTVSQRYGILITELGVSNRVTFVIDPSGKITHIEEGDSAVDPNGAETACRRVKHAP